MPGKSPYPRDRYHSPDNEVGGTMEMEELTKIYHVNGDMRGDYNLVYGRRRTTSDPGALRKRYE